MRLLYGRPEYGEIAETVTFTAACPDCGRDIEWTETRYEQPSPGSWETLDVFERTAPTYDLPCICADEAPRLDAA